MFQTDMDTVDDSISRRIPSLNIREFSRPAVEMGSALRPFTSREAGLYGARK
jgi:hypothetical protein